MNKTNIECYNCDKKIIFFVTVSNRNKKIRKKQKSIDVLSIVSINKNDFIHHMFVILTFMIKKNDAFINYDKLQCHQKFHFSIENEKAGNQWILRFNVEI